MATEAIAAKTLPIGIGWSCWFWLKRWHIVLLMIFGALVIMFLAYVLVAVTVNAQKSFEDYQHVGEGRTIDYSNLSLLSDTNKNTVCLWDQKIDKTIIRCNGSSLETINYILTSMWTEKPPTLGHNLEIELEGTVIRSTGNSVPFHSIAFKNVKSLILRAANINYMTSNTFKGLSALETLHMFDVIVTDTNADILDSVCNTLESFIISESFTGIGRTSLELSDFLCGRITQNNLLQVQVNYNLLGKTIHATDFCGVNGLVVLNLTSCRIEIIAAHTFDNFLRLERLVLDDNRIQTIPTGLFDRILPSYRLYIYIQRNPWHCNCDLCYLNATIEANWWNFIVDSNLCHVTDPLVTLDCTKSECVDRPSTISTTEASTTATNSPGSPLTPPSSSPVPGQQITEADTTVTNPPGLPSTPSSPTPVPVQQITLHCEHNEFPPYVVEVVKVTSRNRALRIHDNMDGTVNVTIRTRSALQTMLLWFDNSDKHFQSLLPQPTTDSDNCAGYAMRRNTDDSYTQTITVDIRPFIPYTFCVMNNITKQLVVSPFNCLSFNKRSLQDGDGDSGGNTWFTDDEKTFTVVMLCIGIVLIFVFGAMLGYVLFCRTCCQRKCGRKARRAAVANATGPIAPRNTTRPPLSRFEIVQRQLIMAQMLHHRQTKPESAYYLQSFVSTGEPNLYESSCGTPTTEAPTQPTTAPAQPEMPEPAFPVDHQQQMDDIMTMTRTTGDGGVSAEPENYYSNAYDMLNNRKG